MPDGNGYAGGGIGLGPSTSWHSVVPAPPPPHPAPEVPARPVALEAVPQRAVKDLARYAMDRGWMVRITYARGSFPNRATGHPGPQKDSLAVRMGKANGDRAVAVYVRGPVTWTWDTLIRWKTGKDPFHRKLSTLGDFQETL